MSVRAKFICKGKEHDTQEPEQGNVLLEAVISGSEENESFFKYTPSGSIRLGIVSSSAFAQFEPGKEYYVDFTAIE